ncbi:DNA methyltransferase [Lactobacillus sp. XV13L]|nr:DNA methyltransferase [Lactobacillus sp. XV13L]
MKSVARVKDLGEVFTPKKTVNFMLDQPEIKAKIQDLTATFLEPAAGEGAFLVELLKRKMHVAEKQSQTAKEYGENCLIALSTLYGIEIMEDNVEMLVMNMIMTFTELYSHVVVTKFSAIRPDSHVLKSAQIIIKANIAQGDTLKGTAADGSPIIFSEWKLINGRVKKVERLEYTFESILNGGEPESAHKQEFEELDLFADYSEIEQDDQEETPKKKYAIVRWTDIYKEELE